jgi:Na+/melibiose symporter-like transporter
VKTSQDSKLESIRDGIWSICGILLLMFGYSNTAIGRSDAGFVIAVLGLIAGIFVTGYVILACVFRSLKRLKEIAEEEDLKALNKKQNKSCEATGDNVSS